MAHRGRTGAVVGQQPFGGARASGTNHKATEAGLNQPELHRRDLRFRCFRRLGELPVYGGVKGQGSSGETGPGHHQVRRRLSRMHRQVRASSTSAAPVAMA
jgi:delta 1-pyrroline-5-carboxylate dehydrogenase